MRVFVTNQARLYGILSMYTDMTDGDEVPLAGVIYVTGKRRRRRRRHRSTHCEPRMAQGPALSFRTLDLVIAQTREARCR